MSKPDTTPPTADLNASDFPPEAVALIAQLQAREEAYQAELNRSQSELNRSQSEVTRLKNELANLWEQVRLHTHQRWTPSLLQNRKSAVVVLRYPRTYLVSRR